MNGQVERANSLILSGIKPRLVEPLERSAGCWIEELPAVLGATAGASAADDPLYDLDTMDFGSPAEPTAAPSLSQPALEPFEFDAPPAAASPAADEDPFALDDVPAATPAAAASEPSFDLADIDLELPSFEQPAAFDADFLAPSSEPALEPAALSPEHMEMETKLDLAIAYQEIGDKEGARELLDEVIKGGSSEQVSKASAMRSLLA